MKTFIVVKCGGLWNPFQRLRARSFGDAMRWCNRNGYDLVEEL